MNTDDAVRLADRVREFIADYAPDGSEASFGALLRELIRDAQAASRVVPAPQLPLEDLTFRLRYALAGLAETFGEGGAEGFAADAAIAALGWCETCGKSPEDAFHVAGFPNGHPFKVMRWDEHWPMDWVTEYREHLVAAVPAPAALLQSESESDGRDDPLANARPPTKSSREGLS